MLSASLPLDTTIDAAARQIHILRKMDTEQRAKMTFELSDSIRTTAEDGIRQRHPDYDDRQVNLARIKLILGTKLFSQISPDSNIDL